MQIGHLGFRARCRDAPSTVLILMQCEGVVNKGARARLEQQDSVWSLMSGFESHRRPKVRVEPRYQNGATHRGRGDVQIVRPGLWMVLRVMAALTTPHPRGLSAGVFCQLAPPVNCVRTLPDRPSDPISRGNRHLGLHPVRGRHCRLSR